MFFFLNLYIIVNMYCILYTYSILYTYTCITRLQYSHNASSKYLSPSDYCFLHPKITSCISLYKEISQTFLNKNNDILTFFLIHYFYHF